MKKVSDQCWHRKGERNEADLLKLRAAFGCRGYAAYQFLKEYQYDSPSGKLHEAAVEIVSLEWGIPEMRDILAFGVAEGIFLHADRMYWIAVVLEDVQRQGSVSPELHEKRAQAGRKGAEARARKFRHREEPLSADNKGVLVSDDHHPEGRTIPGGAPPGSDISPVQDRPEGGSGLANGWQNLAKFGKTGEGGLANPQQNLAKFGKSAQPYNKELSKSTIEDRISSSPEEEGVTSVGATSVHDIKCLPYPSWTREQFITMAHHYGDGNTAPERLQAFIDHWTGMDPSGKLLFAAQKSWSFENKLRNWNRVEDDIVQRVKATHQSINHGKILNPPPAGGPKLRKIGGGQDPKTKAS